MTNNMFNCFQCGREYNAVQCPWCANDHVQRQIFELQRQQMRPQYYNNRPPAGPRDLAAGTVALLIAAACIAWIFASWTAFWWMGGIIILNYLTM